MAIAAEPLSSSRPSSAADWAAVSVVAASETSVTAATVMASAAIAVAVTNDDDHLHDGHDIDDSLHDGYEDAKRDPDVCGYCRTEKMRFCKIFCSSVFWLFVRHTVITGTGYFAQQHSLQMPNFTRSKKG